MQWQILRNLRQQYYLLGLVTTELKASMSHYCQCNSSQEYTTGAHHKKRLSQVKCILNQPTFEGKTGVGNTD